MEQHSIQFSINDTKKLFAFCKIILSEKIDRIERLSLVALKNEAGKLLDYQNESGKNIFAEGSYRYRIPYNKFLIFCRHFDAVKNVKDDVKADFNDWKKHIDKLYSNEIENHDLKDVFEQDDDEGRLKRFSNSIAQLEQYYSFFKSSFQNEALIVDYLSILIARRNQNNVVPQNDSPLISDDEKSLYTIQSIQKDFLTKLFSRRWIIYELGDSSITYRSVDFIFNSYEFIKKNEPSEFKEFANMGRDYEELLDVPTISKFSNHDLDKFFYDASQQAIFLRNSYEEQQSRDMISIYAYKVGPEGEKFSGIALTISNQNKRFIFKPCLLCPLPEELEDCEYNVTRHKELGFADSKFPHQIKYTLEQIDLFKHELFPLVLLHASNIMQRNLSG